MENIKNTLFINVRATGSKANIIIVSEIKNTSEIVTKSRKTSGKSLQNIQ